MPPSPAGRFVDLSHAVEHGMITYPGLPAPVISDFLSRERSRGHYAPGTEFHIGKIEMVANTGTYVDSPFHRYPEGRDLSQLSLASLADLPGVAVRCRERAVTPAAWTGVDVEGKAVLVHTGWDTRWGTHDYFEGHPHLTADAARRLADGGAALVGIDSLNIDDTQDPTRPAHSLLLERGIPIVEHLCRLDRLPETGFRFFAVPAPVKGMGTFPVRAFAILVSS